MSKMSQFSQIHLYFSLCKDCGACCFECGFLDKDSGCSNDDFRVRSRCSSFPIVYGDPESMGHKDLWGNILSSEITDKNKWFIIEFDKCLLLQNEVFFHNLRWILEKINNGEKITGFVVSSEDATLAINPR